MLSRVASSIYWMSRYVERAENVARFVDVNWNLALDLPGGAETQQWLPLVITSGDHGPFTERYGRATKDAVIHFLTFDRENPNSILSCLHAARENARSIREVISPEMWRELNKVYLMVRTAAGTMDRWTSYNQLYEEIKSGCAMVMGVTDATMSHGEGWHFSRMARLLERADKTLRILDVKYFILLPNVEDIGTPYDNIQWAALLRSASAFEMYRQRHGRIEPSRVVTFLLLDRFFPRAVQYCLCKANESLHEISGSPMGTFQNVAERKLGMLQSELSFTRVDQIISQGLHEFVDLFQTKLNDVGEGISVTFFAMRPLQRVEPSPIVGPADADSIGTHG